MRRSTLHLSGFLLFATLLGCSMLRNTPAEKEFRGVWVATVVNIDWPKNANDAASRQKQDFLALLDFYERLNFNTIIVQVRTAGDAFYASAYAPWSRFLTGAEGVPKQDFEDPLQWMIAKTHERGLQFHAWFNPYRATFDLDTTILATTHDFNLHRDWMVRYGNKWYYNPGEPKVWQHLTKVIEEAVKNYDVDAVHFDDYFYPYKIQGERFMDSLTFEQYGLPEQSLEDWRRANVDSLVNNVHRSIKAAKPWVQFGVSPFGVWKNQSTDPAGSDTKAGQTTYEDLYADPLLWMQKGWLDYIVPQAYWSMDYPVASHEKITRWWANKSVNTNLYMGNGAYKVRNNQDKAWYKRKELAKQIHLARSLPNVKGNVFFSAKSLLQHADIVKKLQRRSYKNIAEVPSLPSKPKRILPQPVIISKRRTRDSIHLCLSYYDSIPGYVSIIRAKRKGDEVLKKVYLPANAATHCFGMDNSQSSLSIKVIDGFGNESKSIDVSVKKGLQSN